MCGSRGSSLVDLYLKWPLKGGPKCENNVPYLISQYHRYKRTSEIYRYINHIALLDNLSGTRYQPWIERKKSKQSYGLFIFEVGL